jgi:hypothetical protein
MSNNGQNFNQEQFQNYQMNNSFQNQDPQFINQQQQQQPFNPYGGRNPQGNFQPPVGNFVNKPQSPKIPPPSSTVTKKNYYDPPVPTSTRIRSHKHGSHRNDLNTASFNPLQNPDGQLPQGLLNPSMPPQMQQPGQPNPSMPPQVQQSGQPSEQNFYYQNEQQQHQQLPPQQMPPQMRQQDPNLYYQNEQENQQPPPQTPQQIPQQSYQPEQSEQPGQPGQPEQFGQPEPNFYYQNEQHLQQQPSQQTPQLIPQQLPSNQIEQNYSYQNEQMQPPQQPQTSQQMSSQMLQPGQDPKLYYSNEQQPQEHPQTPRQVNQQMLQPDQPGQERNIYYQNEQQPQPQQTPQQQPQKAPQTPQQMSQQLPNQMPQPNQMDPNLYYQNEQQQSQQPLPQQPPQTPQQMSQQLPSQMPQPNQMDPNLYYQNEQQQSQQPLPQQPPRTPKQMSQQLPNQMPQPNQMDPNLYYQNEQQQSQQPLSQQTPQQTPQQPPQTPQQLPNQIPQPNQLDPNLYYQNEQLQQQQQLQMTQEQNYYYQNEQQPPPQTPTQSSMGIPQTPNQPSIGLPQTPTQPPMSLQSNPQTPVNKPPTQPTTPVSALQNPTGNRNSFDPPLPSSSSYSLKSKKSKHNFKPFRYDGEILTPKKPTFVNETENEQAEISTPTLEPPVEKENNNNNEQISPPISAPKYNMNTSYYMPGYSVEDTNKSIIENEPPIYEQHHETNNMNMSNNESSNNEALNYNYSYSGYSASPVVGEESGNQVTINETENKEYEIENNYGYDTYNSSNNYDQPESKEQTQNNTTVYTGYDTYGISQDTNEQVSKNTTPYSGYDAYGMPQETKEQILSNPTTYSGYDSYNILQESNQATSYNTYDDYNSVPQEKEPEIEIPKTSFMESFGVPKVKHVYKSNETLNPTQRYIQEGIRSRDPLVYLKNGCPIVRFGFGGKIICMFPKAKHIDPNDTKFMYRSINEKMATPGPIIIKSLKSVIDPSLSESEKRFKGPLLNPFNKKRSSNKKEILEQINDRIIQVTSNYSSNSLNDETILWKLIKLFIEYNGVLSGSDVKEEALIELRKLLIPTNRMLKPVTDIKQPIIQSNQIDELEEYLMKGDLDGALEYCKDNNLWTHALIISNFVGKDAYKDVVISYTKSVFGNTIDNEDSMSRPNIQLLYSLFAKGEKEVINSVLPSSVIKSSEKWRTTLATLLGYNTPESVDAIVEFGDSLMKSGNVFAAHICYILSGKDSIFTSVDKEDVRLTLIGVDDRIFGNYALRNPLAVQLTEFYEYGLSLKKKDSNTENGLGIPHFQAYKLAYAWWLSDLGYVQRATEYCKTITKIVQSYTKASPYFHKRFLESLRDLEHRCNRSWLVDEDEDVNIDEWNEKKAKFEVVNDIFSLPNIEKYEMDLIPIELLKEEEEEEEEENEENEVTEEVINKDQESPITPITPASDMMTNQNQNMYGYTGYSIDNSMNNNLGTINTTSYYYDNNYMATTQSQEYSKTVSTDVTSNINAPATSNTQTTSTEATNNTNTNNMYGGYDNMYGSYYSGYNSTPYYPDQNQSQQATIESNQDNAANTQTINNQTTNLNNNMNQPILNYISDVPVIPVSTTSNKYQNTIENSNNNNNNNNTFMNNDSKDNYNNNYDDDDVEDLGFGNNSKLSKEKEKKEEEEEKEEENDEAPPSPSPSKGEHEKEKSSKGFASIFGNLFGSKNNKNEGQGVIKANLGEEKTIYYDPVKKRWVNPNATEEEEKKFAPPPKANSAISPSSTTATTSATPQSNTSSTIPSLTVNNNTLLNKSGKSDIESLLKSSNSTFGISNKRSTSNIKRGARNRYVDVMANSSTKTNNMSSSFLPPPS